MLNARQAQLFSRFLMWKRMDMYGKQRAEVNALVHAGLVRAASKHIYELAV